MSSISRANPTDEPGSGGKILRRRRCPAASPYLRPRLRSLSSSPLPPSPSQHPSSIFGLLASGAGKILSSVFRRSSSGSSSDEDDNDDEEEDDSNKDEMILSDEVQEQGHTCVSLEGIIPVSNKVHATVSQQIPQKSKTKLVIEKLVLQETFSREECTRLIEMIRSRVVDCSSMEVHECANGQRELHQRTAGAGIASPVDWPSLTHMRKLTSEFPYSPGSLSGFSPDASLFKVHGLNLHKTAITEAKKWIEEKKLESSSKSALNLGPCTLNAAASPHGSEDEAASPVDVAKSYMRARPPWASPSFSNVGFKMPEPIGGNLHEDEALHTMSCNSLSSSLGLKRNYPSIDSWDNIEESRRFQLKLTDDRQEPLAIRQINLSARTLEQEASQTSLEADKRETIGVTHTSNSLPALISVDPSMSLPTELAERGDYQDVILHSSDERAIEANCPVNSTSNSNTFEPIPTKIISESVETIDAEDPRQIIPSSITFPSETLYSGPGNDVLAFNSPLPISDRSEDLEEPQQTKEQIGSSCVEPLTRDSMPAQDNGTGYLLTKALNSEPKALLTCALSCDVDGAADPNDAGASSQQMSSQLKDSLQPHQLSGLNETHPTLDSSSQGGGDQMQADSRSHGGGDQMYTKANRFECQFDGNGSRSSHSSYSQGKRNGDPSLRPSDETQLDSTIGCDGNLASGDQVEICDFLSEASIEVPLTDEADSVVDGLENSSSGKPNDELVQIHTRQKREGKRGKKAGGYYRRAKGRSK